VLATDDGEELADDSLGQGDAARLVRALEPGNERVETVGEAASRGLCNRSVAPENCCSSGEQPVG
jgi:hypothetical protein